MTGAPQTPAPAPGGPSLWHHADFLRFWTGDTISQFGSQITQLALPLVAALILQVTPFEFALLGTLEMLPFLLISLPAGVWVDRLRRRPILIGADLVRAVALATIPLAFFTGNLSIWLLYVVAIVQGLATVFFDVAYQAYLPSLVEREQLIEGNSKLEISRSAAAIAGPGLAGALFGVLRVYAIVLDSLSFLASALAVWGVRRREPVPQPHPAEGRSGMLAEIREGLGVVLGNPVLRAIAGTTSTSNLFGSIAFATLILFATQQLGLDAVRIGVIFGLGNVGALVGAVIAGRLPKLLGAGRTIMLGIVVGAVAVLFVPLATPGTAFALLLVSSFGGAIGSMVYNINQVSLRQSITPDRLQGRMNASMRFIVWGTIPIGTLIGGVLAATVDLRGAIWVGAIGGLTAVLWLVFSPIRTMREAPPPWEAPAAETAEVAQEAEAAETTS